MTDDSTTETDEPEQCRHYGCSREPWENGLCQLHVANP
jgi:hypothetical protein